jgi:hypothetical protein
MFRKALISICGCSLSARSSSSGSSPANACRRKPSRVAAGVSAMRSSIAYLALSTDWRTSSSTWSSMDVSWATKRSRSCHHSRCRSWGAAARTPSRFRRPSAATHSYGAAGAALALRPSKTVPMWLVGRVRTPDLLFPEKHGSLRAQVDTGHRGAQCPSLS